MADVSQQMTYGGQHTENVAAGTGAANVVVYAPAALPSGAQGSNPSGGRLCRITVLTAATAILVLYDNASTDSGNILFVVPSNAPVGAIYDVQMPFDNGIVALQASGSPQVAISYNVDATGGRGVGGR
ncbi:MAG: hypothetical protein KGL39_07905 [Patescibacteria group bacterium]|nr:hypothetical protein [Patescibacteria group bacterium]